MSEADEDHDEPPFRAPLPLDDRLWRHPSELGTEGGGRSGLATLLSSFFFRQRR